MDGLLLSESASSVHFILFRQFRCCLFKLKTPYCGQHIILLRNGKKNGFSRWMLELGGGSNGDLFFFVLAVAFHLCWTTIC